MKKTVLTTLAVACLAIVVYIASGSSFNAKEHYIKSEITDGDKSKMDTISYMVGLDLGDALNNSIMPLWQTDYEVIMSTLKEVVNGAETIVAGDKEITKENILQHLNEFFTPEMQNKAMEASRDTTGTLKIYSTPEEQAFASKLFGAEFGFNITTSMNFPVQTYWILQGIEDVKNSSQKFDRQAIGQYFQNYFTNVMPGKYKKDSERWLTEIEQDGDVQKTATGIRYIILEEGDANTKAIADSDTVEVLYTGRTMDGNVFDSNVWVNIPAQRKEMIKLYQPNMENKDNPVKFPLDGVIKGWTEGMKLIGKGGKIILWIPDSLAYGERGTRGIPPHATLRFDVELLDVKTTQP